MELRNPSDALQILACSGRDTASVTSSSYHPSTSPGNQTTSDVCVAGSISETRSARHHYHYNHHGGTVVRGPGISESPEALNDYELVRKFMLHPILIAELLQV